MATVDFRLNDHTGFDENQLTQNQSNFLPNAISLNPIISSNQLINDAKYNNSILENRQLELLSSPTTIDYDEDDNSILENRQLELLSSPTTIDYDEDDNSILGAYQLDTNTEKHITSSDDYYKEANQINRPNKKRNREEFESPAANSSKKRKIDSSVTSNETPQETLNKIEYIVNNLLNQKINTFDDLTIKDCKALAKIKRIKKLLLN
jgi:hypothetical protein